MAQTPEYIYITVDIRTIPEIRQLLADVWEEGFDAGEPVRDEFSPRNPYREAD